MQGNVGCIMERRAMNLNWCARSHVLSKCACIEFALVQTDSIFGKLVEIQKRLSERCALAGWCVVVSLLLRSWELCSLVQPLKGGVDKPQGDCDGKVRRTREWRYFAAIGWGGLSTLRCAG